MKIYIVSWLYTTIDENDILNHDTGTYEIAYRDEKKAIEQVNKLTKDKLNYLENEFGDVDEIDTETNENGDWQQVSHGNDTFEYYVEEVIVD